MPPPVKQPPLDFEKVEALRKHMMLTIAQFAKLLGVSRVTYNAWVAGGPIRRANDRRVRETLRELLKVMTERHWPTPDVIAMTSKQRMDTLLEVMNPTE